VAEDARDITDVIALVVLVVFLGLLITSSSLPANPCAAAPTTRR